MLGYFILESFRKPKFKWLVFVKGFICISIQLASWFYMRETELPIISYSFFFLFFSPFITRWICSIGPFNRNTQSSVNQRYKLSEKIAAYRSSSFWLSSPWKWIKAGAEAKARQKRQTLTYGIKQIAEIIVGPRRSDKHRYRQWYTCGQCNRNR